MATLNNVKRNKIESVTITLDEQEAEALFAICRRIGGCPKNSPRMHVDAIASVLDDAGVQAREFKLRPGNDSIYFMDGFDTEDRHRR